ncbi:hypothetical protein AMTR_s00101p00056930 [Amborella trichopoda]|uniref:Uncharacterized protein n=1 Tax=Amborella trichopoda TaxID=13333 RepID=W1NTY3_AMBTC|nr:hypothetical protein AMTR_s00101p00056930 [Amborella trichopoda]
MVDIPWGQRATFAPDGHYNQKLRERHQELENNEREALEVDEMDDTSEWLVDAGDDEVFPTWGKVRKVIATPLSPMRTTQSQSQNRGKGKAKEKGKRLTKLRDEDETNSDEARDAAKYVEEGNYYDDDGIMPSNSIPGGDDTEWSF